jgi:hypothetical protein
LRHEIFTISSAPFQFQLHQEIPVVPILTFNTVFSICTPVFQTRAMLVTTSRILQKKYFTS